MKEAVIVSAVRTAVGKAPKGTLRNTRPDEMGGAVIREALARVPGLEASEIEDVIMGCAMPEAEQGMNVARAAAIRAGLPVETSAMTINRFCSSGLQSIAMAMPSQSWPPLSTTASGATGVQAYVGGVTATFIDISDRIADRLPYFILAVVLLSFLLLMLVFHSILVPLTAAVMNLLSVAAAYGVIVAVFQWGWAKDLIGLESTVPIVSFVPMMMFAVLFGLSMDYQVFLLTRVREEYDASGNTRQAIVRGLSRTARVITSAALIMIFVFGAFVLNNSPEVKMFGLGLAFAVLIDATIVRMMLVPSVMEILGDANWWFPKWLGWLPRLDIDSSPGQPASPAPEPTPAPAGV